MKQGDAYLAKLTPITEYTITDVCVTMGGADITAAVYSDGTIFIPMVTSDIVITAVASDAWEVVRELTANDIAFKTALNTKSPYYYALVTRASYTAFDIPVEYGYEYKFEFESTLETAQMANQMYNAKALDAVAAGEEFTAADYSDSGWKSSGYTKVAPEKVNGSPVAGVRLVFRANESNSSVTDGFIKKVTIKRRAV